MPEGWATIPGLLPPGHLPRPPWAGQVRLPCRREQVVMAQTPCDARHEEDGEEDSGDKDMPRSLRDAEHARRGNRNEASLGTVTNKQILPTTGQGVLKKPPTTKIRSLCPLTSTGVPAIGPYAHHCPSMLAVSQAESYLSPSACARTPTWLGDGDSAPSTWLGRCRARAEPQL